MDEYTEHCAALWHKSYHEKVIEILKNSTLFMFMQQASGARAHATAINLAPMLITE